VAEVRARARVEQLDARHAQALVAALDDVRGVEAAHEGGPAGAGLELVLGAEERQAAHDRDVDALLVVLDQRARVGALRAGALRDLDLLGRERLRDLGDALLGERAQVIAGLGDRCAGRAGGLHGLALLELGMAAAAGEQGGDRDGGQQNELDPGGFHWTRVYACPPGL
jgi:hypothetical protein